MEITKGELINNEKQNAMPKIENKMLKEPIKIPESEKIDEGVQKIQNVKRE